VGRRRESTHQSLAQAEPVAGESRCREGKEGRGGRLVGARRRSRIPRFAFVQRRGGGGGGEECAFLCAEQGDRRNCGSEGSRRYRSLSEPMGYLFIISPEEMMQQEESP